MRQVTASALDRLDQLVDSLDALENGEGSRAERDAAVDLQELIEDQAGRYGVPEYNARYANGSEAFAEGILTRVLDDGPDLGPGAAALVERLVSRRNVG